MGYVFLGLFKNLVNHKSLLILGNSCFVTFLFWNLQIVRKTKIECSLFKLIHKNNKWISKCIKTCFIYDIRNWIMLWLRLNNEIVLSNLYLCILWVSNLNSMIIKFLYYFTLRKWHPLAMEFPRKRGFSKLMFFNHE